MLRLDNNKYIQIVYNKSSELNDSSQKSFYVDNQYEEGDSEDEN